MRYFVRLILVLLISTSTSTSAAELTAEQLTKLDIRPVPGKPLLYVIPGFGGSVSGGNVAVLVTGAGVVVVDNKFDYSFDDIVAKIGTITSQAVHTVINTHHHYDHAGANPSFIPIARVISHDNARANMLANRRASADPTGAPPFTYSDAASLHVGGDEIQIHYFGRGHTDGDSVVFFPSLRTVHTGDLFIWGDRLDGSKLAPFMDYDNGASAKAWVATLEQILALDFDTVIPGHGPILGRPEVEAFRHRMEVLVSRVAQAATQGVSRDNLSKAVALDDLDWPLAPERLQAIYDELIVQD